MPVCADAKLTHGAEIRCPRRMGVNAGAMRLPAAVPGSDTIGALGQSGVGANTWLGATLAVASYLALHSYANAPHELATAKPGQMGALASGAFLRVIARYGQYVLPLLCLVGATISAVRRHQRAALLHDVTTGDGAAALNAMTWQQFELVVGEWFRQQGYAVKELGGPGPDGGIDLRLKKTMKPS